MIGVSGSLVGNRVRYDGGDRLEGYIAHFLARHAEFAPFCPETAIGLGVPRPPIQLVRRGGEVGAVGITDPHRDVTDPLADSLADLARNMDEPSGFILKSRSPSCGMERVPVKLMPQHLCAFPDEYTANQAWLEPHPRELMSRSHV